MSAPGGEGAKSGLSIMEVAGGNTVNIKQPAYFLNFAFKCLPKGGKRGVEGETSAADRETRKKAKVNFPMMNIYKRWFHPGGLQ